MGSTPAHIISAALRDVRRETRDGANKAAASKASPRESSQAQGALRGSALQAASHELALGARISGDAHQSQSAEDARCKCFTTACLWDGRVDSTCLGDPPISIFFRCQSYSRDSQVMWKARWSRTKKALQNWRDASCLRHPSLAVARLECTLTDGGRREAEERQKCSKASSAKCPTRPRHTCHSTDGAQQ